MHKIKFLRGELGYTQQELAEKASLSLRTIQRIESGNTVPKGHTLRVLAKALEVEPQLLVNTTERENADVIKSKIRLINLSAVVFLAVPFGNILVPIIVWQKAKKIDPLVEESGKQIINYQIWWSILLCIFLSSSPFLQFFFFPKFPLILIVLFVFIFINFFFIAWVTTQINKGNYRFFTSKWSLI
ncbi:MAG: helix-turn-helix domain-containing protein [Bacteroidota bacterium]